LSVRAARQYFALFPKAPIDASMPQKPKPNASAIDVVLSPIVEEVNPDLEMIRANTE
jgi:hypothetical protein